MRDWLSFFCFTYFTDRDGKYQLKSFAESAFDPLSRTCRFMLTEEAHHMFVGETGIGRIVKRTLEVMKELGTDDPSRVRAHGAIDLPTLQKYLNFWYSVSLDLFGSEVSTNGASYFGGGLKGRAKEERYADHVLLDGSVNVELMEDGRIVQQEVAPRMAVNLEVRAAYVEDCESAIEKWNKVVAGLGVELKLPSQRFHRGVGTFAGHFFDPDGTMMSETEFRRRESEFLPSEADQGYVRSLMARPVTEPGQFANWIAPPAQGANNQPLDFQYVKFH
jgi:benzoyl-CoA 2,3-dioxygenase component B